MSMSDIDININLQVKTRDAIKPLSSVDKEVDKLNKRIDKSKTKLKAYGQGFSSAGRQVRNFGLAFGYASAQAVKFEVQLDKSVRRANTLIKNFTSESRREIRDFATGLGSAFGVGFESIADSVYESLSAGLDASNYARFTSDAMVLAMAETTDTATAVDYLTTIVQGMNMEWSDTARIMNVASIAIDDGKITMDQLNHSVANAVPFAAGLGLAYEDLAAGLSVATLNGIKADEASINWFKAFVYFNARPN